MKCTVCGARMSPTATDLPFKLSEGRLVIRKQLPVVQEMLCLSSRWEVDRVLKQAHA